MASESTDIQRVAAAGLQVQTPYNSVFGITHSVGHHIVINGTTTSNNGNAVTSLAVPGSEGGANTAVDVVYLTTYATRTLNETATTLPSPAGNVGVSTRGRMRSLKQDAGSDVVTVTQSAFHYFGTHNRLVFAGYGELIGVYRSVV